MAVQQALLSSTVRNATLLSTLTALGLTTNLKVCLDAGDALSYTSGESWLDRSGGGYDFFRGASGSSSTDDPTFNGVPGDLTNGEYWSFDGGDLFTYDSANETWMENLHKANAAFTMAVWYNPSSTSATASLVKTRQTGSTIGIDFQLINSGNRPQLVVGNGSSSGVFSPVSVGGTVTAGAWNFFAVSVDLPGNVQVIQRNDTQATGAAAYTSPSASSAAAVMAMGINNPFPSGSRMAEVAMWEGSALTASQLTSLHNATRGRFGV